MLHCRCTDDSRTYVSVATFAGMEAKDYLTLREAKDLTGYGDTSLRNAFDDETSPVTGIRVDVKGNSVRRFDRQSLLDWVATTPQGPRKQKLASQGLSAQPTSPFSAPLRSAQNLDAGYAAPRAGDETPSADPRREPRQSRSPTRSAAEVHESLDDLRVENEGQAAVIEQLLDSLVSEAESRYKQLARLAQAFKTSEAARPGRRRLKDLSDDLAAMWEDRSEEP
jgi:hypothetical protein